MLPEQRQQLPSRWAQLSRCLRVAIQGGSHPVTAKGGGPQTIGNAVDIGHQRRPQLPPGPADQLLQLLAAWPYPLGGVKGDHICPRAPHRKDFLPARGDVHRAVGEAALPQAHNQGIGAATSHRPDMFRAFQPHPAGTIAQTGLRHGRDHIGVAHGGTLRSLNRNDQAARIGPNFCHHWASLGKIYRTSQTDSLQLDSPQPDNAPSQGRLGELAIEQGPNQQKQSCRQHRQDPQAGCGGHGAKGCFQHHR